MLGALAKNLGFDYAKFESALKRTVPPKFLEMNVSAFEKGYFGK